MILEGETLFTPDKINVAQQRVVRFFACSVYSVIKTT